MRDACTQGTCINKLGEKGQTHPGCRVWARREGTVTETSREFGLPITLITGAEAGWSEAL